MYGGIRRSKYIVSLVSKNETNDGSSSSRMDSTSNSLLGKNKINNHDALVINNTNDQSKSENCNELQKKIDEAIKVLIGDCGEQIIIVMEQTGEW